MGMMFFPGRICATRDIVNKWKTEKDLEDFCKKCLDKHLNCDWGEVTEQQRKDNDKALKTHKKIISSYVYYPTGDVVKIETDADHNVTIVSLTMLS